jgi:hypothetical protein
MVPVSHALVFVCAQGDREVMEIALGTLLLSIIIDIVVLGIYAKDTFDVSTSNTQVTTAKFCMAMAIINLIVKPLTSFIAYIDLTQRHTADVSGGFVAAAQPAGHYEPAPYVQAPSGTNASTGSYMAPMQPA